MAKKSLIAKAKRRPKFEVDPTTGVPFVVGRGHTSEIWDLPDLFSEHGSQRRVARRDQSQLVAL